MNYILKYKKLILAIIIFVVSVVSYYYPVYKKGYASGADFINLSEARNFAISGTYNYESNDGAHLSSGRALTEGRVIGIPNPLTPIIYGYIFKFTDSGNLNLLLPLYISIVLAAIFNVILFLILAGLFNTISGFISAILMALMPVRMIGTIYFGSYEFAMIFFAIAVCLYLGSKKGIFSAGLVRVFMASLFFALTALARNAFLFSFAPFLLYDFYKNRSYKRSLIFILPFLIIFGSTLTPYSWLGTPNGYMGGIDSQPFAQLGHVFNDPYSAYYNRDNVLKEIESSGLLDRHEVHFLKQWGYEISWSEQLGAYKDSAIFYITEAIDLVNFGGPIIILFMLFGVYWLYLNKKDILWLFCLWVFIWSAGLIYYETSNWDHFLEIIPVIAALAGLGVCQVWRWVGIGMNINNRYINYGLGALIVILLLGHLSYANKWRLYDTYRSSQMGPTMEITEAINKNNTRGVVAVGIHPALVDGVYYFTNRDIVYFNPVTVNELIQNGKLKEAFSIYNVKIAVGFSNSVSADIKNLTGVEIIPYDPEGK